MAKKKVTVPKRFMVVGVGGTGGYLLDPAIRVLESHYGGNDQNVWQLGLIDGDTIEAKNLSRQRFSETQIGMNKAMAAHTAYADRGNILAIPEYLGPNNIKQYITEGSVVMIAADNFKVRALIEEHCATLKDVTVINGGNERSTGSSQLWIRKDGKDVTPRLSFLHPEILIDDGDRSGMSCMEIAALPGGEQLIITNMASALWMLTDLISITVNEAEPLQFTEIQFDVVSGQHEAIDMRERRGWQDV